MKALRVIGLMGLMAVAAGAQTAVVFPLKQMTGTAHRRELTVTSLDGVRKVGTNLIYPVPMTVIAQGGQFRTNLFTGNYRLTMQGVPGYSDAFVPSTNVVVYWNDLVAATPSALTLSQYYTKEQIDALLAAIGGGGGTCTNVSVAYGDALKLEGPLEGYPWYWTNVNGSLYLRYGNDPVTAMQMDTEGVVTFPRSFTFLPNPDPYEVGQAITVNPAGGMELTDELSNMNRITLKDGHVELSNVTDIFQTNAVLYLANLENGAVWGFDGLNGRMEMPETGGAPTNSATPEQWVAVKIGGAIHYFPAFR